MAGRQSGAIDADLVSLPPLVFSPIYRRYIWGGRRFVEAFGRDLPPGNDYAESWELVDRGTDQSVVAEGSLAGVTLGSLVREHGLDLLGRHARYDAFPLLFKFLDANQVLSVQVHPDDVRARVLDPPDRGKTEAWYVIDAAPGSRIYAGLREGVSSEDLTAAIRAGTCESVLHSFEPRAGDCVFIPAGTVHAIGAGLLVAEIQQSSDVTYRLFDWNRTGPDGKSRPLHIDKGIQAVTHLGPVEPVRRLTNSDSAVRRLVACDFFILDEVTPTSGWQVGGDGRLHFLVVLDGELQLSAPWSLPAVAVGGCVLLPASLEEQSVTASKATRLLHVTLP